MTTRLVLIRDGTEMVDVYRFRNSLSKGAEVGLFEDSEEMRLLQEGEQVVIYTDDRHEGRTIAWGWAPRL